MSFSGLLLLLLCHTIVAPGNFTGEAPEVFSINPAKDYDTVHPEQRNSSGILPFSDPFFEHYPLQKEYDDGRSPFQFLSQAGFRTDSLLLIAVPGLMPGSRLIISPSLDTRTIIYPFHSFL